ncbi:MAG: hypothetical protein AAGE43_16380 [Pseudomonadota bacterium]
MSQNRNRQLLLAVLSGLLWFPLWNLTELLPDNAPEALGMILGTSPGAAFGALVLVQLLPQGVRPPFRVISLIGAGWLSYYLALSSLRLTELDPFGLSVVAAGAIGVSVVLVAVRLLLAMRLQLREVIRALLAGIAAGLLVWVGLEIDDQLAGFGPSDYLELLIWPGHLLFNTLVCSVLLESLKSSSLSKLK